MKAPPFRYHRPSTIAEAVELLATLDNARAIAGGQSLMPMMNLRLVAPDHLIDLGGSLCHLDPGAELPVAAASLDAVLVAIGRSGERRIPFDEFSVGLLSNALSPDELLARIELPKTAPRTGTAFLEFNRRPADFAVVSVATSLALDTTGRIAQAAIRV